MKANATKSLLLTSLVTLLLLVLLIPTVLAGPLRNLRSGRGRPDGRRNP